MSTLAQPTIEPDRLAAASGALTRFRVMAFVTGFVLLAGTIALILKESGVKHMEPGTGILWLFHGYLYLVYVITVAMLGVKLRWPLARFALVMLAGTIPTMSFVAEHFVTRAARSASAGAVAAPGAAAETLD
jgi:integral membrane protein